jgi:exosortase/archaeosortase family protein
MLVNDKIKAFFEKRSNLDIFLMKAGGLVLLYYLLRITIKFTPFLKPIFVISKKGLIWLIVNSSNLILGVLGYDSQVNENVVYIVGTAGVKVINACLGWSVMAMFIGFIVIYPSVKKAKFWYIPMGLLIIVFVNILRIAGMTIISYENYDALEFFHRYIFNFSIYIVVFILWYIWVNKFGKKREFEK